MKNNWEKNAVEAVKNLKAVFVCNNVLEKVQNTPPKMLLNFM